MHTKYSLAALSDDALDRGIQTCAARKHATDAELLAFIAEYDSRRRYLALGYDSMLAFCVQALHLSEDATYKRLQVVRVAQEFPCVLPALAEGRLNLTGVNLLAPHLTAENADELIAAATHKSKAEIREFLAERCPQKQASRMSLLSVANEPSTGSAQEGAGEPAQLAPAQVEGEQTKLAPEQVEEVDCWARITPLSGDRYSVSLTIDRATHELWRHNQSLLSHQIPSGNLAEVLRRSLAESARLLEKRRFRSSGKARRPRCPKPGSRYVPKHVRDAVWRRDGGECTFVGETGHRCGSRTRLELDHIVPVARGGASTVDNLRLRCRVHNQFEAERALGVEFMRHKRERARDAVNAHRSAGSSLRMSSAATERRETEVPAKTPTTDVSASGDATAPSSAGPMESGAIARPPAKPVRDWFAEARARADAAGHTPDHDELDVVPWLRKLGVRAEDARRAGAWCETIPDAPLAERIRVAIRYLHAKPKQGGSAERTVA